MSPARQSLPFPFPLDGQTIRTRRAAILSMLLREDEGFCSIPVQKMKATTPERMLWLYDELFLNGYLRRSFSTLRISLSSRLISSAGKFIYKRDPAKRMSDAEIRMSSDFLFRLNEGPFLLNGLTVATAQEAFLVVFEHELCHALETALYGATGHSRRFLTLANGLFGHTATTHSLPTRRQEAAQSGLTIGSKVSFLYEDRMLTGIVSYIGKTATVMVPDWRGTYKDKRGKRYSKFRVPLSELK